MDPAVEELPYAIPWSKQLAQEAEWPPTLAAGLPAGYQSYVRVFHPFVAWDLEPGTPVLPDRVVRWGHLGDLAGVPFGPLMTWRQLLPVLPESAEGRPYSVWEGDLEPNTAKTLFDLLASHGDGPYYFAFHLNAIIRADRHEPPLYSAPSLDHRDAVCGHVGAGSPTYVWPEDRRWIVWTDYDLAATYVAVSNDAARSIASLTNVETALIELSDRIDDRADEQPQ